MFSSETQEVKLDQVFPHFHLCAGLSDCLLQRGKKVQMKLPGTAPRSVESGKMKQVFYMYSFHPGASALMEHQLKK